MNLGTRNNNWLNIRYNPHNKWKGQTGEDSGFCVFDTVGHGLRAGRIIIENYLKEGFDLVGDIIARWAPPTENLTDNYVNNVCSWTGYDKHEKILIGEVPFLIKAMVRQETGNVVSDELMTEMEER